MKQVLISDNEGTGYTGQIPEGWHEVPVSTFIQYEAEIKQLSKGQRLVQMASLLSGIPTHVLEADVSLAARIHAECPFFFNSLPQPVPVENINHQGKAFEFIGNMDKLTAGQFEALLEYINQATDKPLTMINWLLAILYQEKDVPQTAETVAANADLFLTLPMDVAYGAVGFFFASYHRISTENPKVFAAGARSKQLHQETRSAANPREQFFQTWHFTAKIFWLAAFQVAQVKRIREQRLSDVLDDMATLHDIEQFQEDLQELSKPNQV